MVGVIEDVAEVARWAKGIEGVHECIAGRFRRPEPRRRALDYLRGLLSAVERKNGWQLAERALESGVPFGWVTGDEVYGNDRRLRLWLERRDVPHVLAIRSNEKLWAETERGWRQVRADRLAPGVEEPGWVRRSAGDGAKGPRVYDWARVEIRPLKEPGQG